MTKRLLASIAAILWSASLFAPSGRDGAFGIVSNLEDEAIADEVDGLEIRWVRMTLYWSRIEVTPDRFVWTAADRQVRRAIHNDLNIFLTLEGTPRWANGGKGPEYPPENAHDFADFARQVADRYGKAPQVVAIGMWNEPNLSRFWKGSSKEYQKKILAPGSRAVKSTSGRLKVAAPEMSHHWKKQSKWQLKDLLDTRDAVIDLISLHYYPDSEDRLDVYLRETVDPQRKDKTVWITEMGEKGFPDNRCSLDRQSHFYASMAALGTEAFPWVERIFAYRIWDPEPLEKNEDPFAITYGKPPRRKPAYDTFRDLIAGRPFRDPFPECHP